MKGRVPAFVQASDLSVMSVVFCTEVLPRLPSIYSCVCDALLLLKVVYFKFCFSFFVCVWLAVEMEFISI